MDGAVASFSSEARVVTPAAGRYLVQLCKHFEHKLAVTLEEGRGRIEFPAGSCACDATTAPGTLILRVRAQEETALPTLEGVIERHLKRFAFRETLAVAWTRGPRV